MAQALPEHHSRGIEDSVTASPPISVIVTCKGRLAHLRHTLPALRLAFSSAELVLVDYDCPERSGDWAEANVPGVKVVRATDRPTFNIARARNLGAAAATAPWLMFTDADVLFTTPLEDRLAAGMQGRVYLLTDPRPPILFGTALMRAADFQAVGGYDEVFEGWGSEDSDLLRRLDAAGVRRTTFDATGVFGIEHDDAARAAFHTIAKDLNWTINAVYASAKEDLAKMGWDARLPERQALYAGVRAALDGAAFDDRTVSHRIAFRRESFGGLDVVTSLKYDIHMRDLRTQAPEASDDQPAPVQDGPGAP